MSVLDKIKKISIKNKLLIFGSILVVVGVLLSLPNAFADLTPVRSVTITSEKLDYTKKEPGSFNIEKSAEWIAKGKARITFDVDTVRRLDKKNTDIIFVLDVSGSMDGDKLTRVKQDSVDLINTLLSDSNNRAALITFESDSQLVLPLINDNENLVNTINSLTTGDMTNYYQPLVHVDTILKDYKKEENRECIVLFLTDGYPNEDTPNEEGQYRYLKKQYPYITINGVQYEMGSDVLDPIKKVSDQQFIADMTNLNNVLFKASVAPITYDSFQIIDYINDDYFEIDSVDRITSNAGTYFLEYEGKVPKVIWNIENLRSGLKATLAIDVNLKKEFLNTGGVYPTNKKEEIKTEIDGVREEITSPKTPILSSYYQVIYDGNVPENCTVKNIPETTTRNVFDTVEISNHSAVCDGYQFKGWTIATENIKKINDNYFEMPSSDVVIRANWGKMNIAKSIDGEVYVAPPSIIKSVTYNQNTELWKYKSSITKIVFENSISDKNNAKETFDISEEKNQSVMGHIVPNDDGTTHTAYIQGNEKVIANENSSYLFSGFTKLVSIEGLEYFDTSNIEIMYYMFCECRNLTSLDLGYFDTSNVIYMNSMFYGCNKLTNINLSSFNTSQVTCMEFMFYDCNSLASLDISDFDTSNVEDMISMFTNCSSDLSHLDTSKVTNMDHMFEGCVKLINLDVSHFDTSKISDMSFMFTGCLNLITTITIMNNNTTSYTNMFSYSATDDGSQITVNYTSETSDLVDKMIATKSTNSNVVKGELLS